MLLISHCQIDIRLHVTNTGEPSATLATIEEATRSGRRDDSTKKDRSAPQRLTPTASLSHPPNNSQKIMAADTIVAATATALSTLSTARPPVVQFLGLT